MTMIEETKPFAELADPTDEELWAIEADGELLAGELALVDAECAWFAQPGPDTAADVLQAVIDLVDLHDLCTHEPAGAVA